MNSIETARSLSIIINNYNYAEYIAACIQSALNQSQPAHEIIVVDDGSTDESLDIIKKFAPQVRLISQTNQGQAAAMNSGFAASSGELIVFLDADDCLHEEAVEHITHTWKNGTAKLQYPLQIINRAGITLGQMPPDPKILPRGELLTTLLENGTYNWMPTSGNAFARETLSKIMPIPAEQFRISADLYLSICSVRYGLVQAAAKALGKYRLHGENAFASNHMLAPDEKTYASRIVSHINRHLLLKEEAAKSNYALPTDARCYYTTFYAWIDITLSLRLFGEESIIPYRKEEIATGVRERTKRQFSKPHQKWKSLIIRFVFCYLLHCPHILLKPSLAVGRKLEPILFAQIQKTISS
ncbi:glycosyltransferase [Coraliomargarita sp. SDUM461004]|uniref:Glycosyltransferase n=1 Tax=Thalassobacterium sedimentorum TaxID=3041258 RepID=A0ABU1AET5_9BACT|nr:glycosyltransferase [Coraliomargarita sp. SDUM461004]MDQ8193295.1 glycosyltransferase [Coraliomargarita sp. SDUM461004]